MIFNHRVKHNGVTYPAGADVPVGNAIEVKKEEPVIAEPAKEEAKLAKPKSGNRKTKK